MVLEFQFGWMLILTREYTRPPLLLIELPARILYADNFPLKQKSINLLLLKVAHYVLRTMSSAQRVTTGHY